MSKMFFTLEILCALLQLFGFTEGVAATARAINWDIYSSPKNGLLKIIAHRGAGVLAPENTVAAVSAAIALGFDFVELDVQTTRDGSLVLMHDRTVDRTTSGKGYVSDLSLQEVRRLDAGAKFNQSYRGERVPTLAEILKLIKGRINVYLDWIEAKPEDLVREIRVNNAMANVLIRTDFAHRLAIRAVDSRVHVAVAVEGLFDMLSFVETDPSIEAFTIDTESITDELVKLTRAYGIDLIALHWGLNDGCSYMRVDFLRGIYALMTDFPDMARKCGKLSGLSGDFLGWGGRESHSTKCMVK